MVIHPTQLPLFSSFSAQAAASELLPNPAGALMTPSRLAGSSDKMARSRGRATNPRNRAGTILVARNGTGPPPGKVPVPYVRWLKRGWIKGSPYPRRSSPHSGDANNVESVRSLLARGKRQASLALQASRSRSPRADPLGKESRSKLMSIRNARLGFAQMIEHLRQAH